MVPEDLVEEAAVGASDSAAPSNPTVQPEVAPGTEGGIVGFVRDSWADLSEEPPSPIAATEAPVDPEEAGVEASTIGEVCSGEGAAFGAPGEADSETEHQPGFDDLSILDHPQGEETVPTAEDIFELLQTEPIAEDAQGEQPTLEHEVPSAEANIVDEQIDNQAALDEGEQLETPVFEPPSETHTTEVKEEVDFEEVEVEVEVDTTPAGATTTTSLEAPSEVEAGDDSVPPPPTSPFLEAAGAAEGAPGSGHLQVGHSPSAPSRPPRHRGKKAGKARQTSRLIKRWQSDFDKLANWVWENTGFWLILSV